MNENERNLIDEVRDPLRAARGILPFGTLASVHVGQKNGQAQRRVIGNCGGRAPDAKDAGNLRTLEQVARRGELHPLPWLVGISHRDKGAAASFSWGMRHNDY